MRESQISFKKISLKSAMSFSEKSGSISPTNARPPVGGERPNKKDQRKSL